VLKEKLGTKRILLNDDQRQRLAVKGKILGRKLLEQVATIVTPDTILRWRQELVAAKWDYSRRRRKIGRPPASAKVVELVLRRARENPGWGCDGIQGALANLGHLISNTWVGSILKAHGVDPAPVRKRQLSGRASSRPIGMSWTPSTSRQSKSGPRAGWSPSICSLSWSWQHGECTSPAAPSIPTNRGCSRLPDYSELGIGVPMPSSGLCRVNLSRLRPARVLVPQTRHNS